MADPHSRQGVSIIMRRLGLESYFLAAIDVICQAVPLLVPHLSCATPDFPRVLPALTKSGVTSWGLD